MLFVLILNRYYAPIFWRPHECEEVAKHEEKRVFHFYVPAWPKQTGAYVQHLEICSEKCIPFSRGCLGTFDLSHL